MNDRARMALIVDLMTETEQMDLARAIDDFRQGRELPDDLGPLWRTLMRRSEQQLEAETSERSGGSEKLTGLELLTY